MNKVEYIESRCKSFLYTGRARVADIHDQEKEERIIDGIYTAMKLIPDHDLSDLNIFVGCYFWENFMASFNHKFITVNVNNFMIGNEHLMDIIFMILHEFRHYFQNKEKILVSDGGEVTWNKDELFKINWFDIKNSEWEDYIRLPWEKDANAFASSTMGNYTPHNQKLARMVEVSGETK